MAPDTDWLDNLAVAPDPADIVTGREPTYVQTVEPRQTDPEEMSALEEMAKFLPQDSPFHKMNIETKRGVLDRVREYYNEVNDSNELKTSSDMSVNEYGEMAGRLSESLGVPVPEPKDTRRFTERNPELAFLTKFGFDLGGSTAGAAAGTAAAAPYAAGLSGIPVAGPFLAGGTLLGGAVLGAAGGNVVSGQANDFATALVDGGDRALNPVTTDTWNQAAIDPLKRAVDPYVALDRAMEGGTNELIGRGVLSGARGALGAVGKSLGYNVSPVDQMVKGLGFPEDAARSVFGSKEAALQAMKNNPDGDTAKQFISDFGDSIYQVFRPTPTMAKNQSFRDATDRLFQGGNDSFWSRVANRVDHKTAPFRALQGQIDEDIRGVSSLDSNFVELPVEEAAAIADSKIADVAKGATKGKLIVRQEAIHKELRQLSDANLPQRRALAVGELESRIPEAQSKAQALIGKIDEDYFGQRFDVDGAPESDVFLPKALKHLFDLSKSAVEKMDNVTISDSVEALKFARNKLTKIDDATRVNYGQPIRAMENALDSAIGEVAPLADKLTRAKKGNYLPLVEEAREAVYGRVDMNAIQPVAEEVKRLFDASLAQGKNEFDTLSELKGKFAELGKKAFGNAQQASVSENAYKEVAMILREAELEAAGVVSPALKESLGQVNREISDRLMVMPMIGQGLQRQAVSNDAAQKESFKQINRISDIAKTVNFDGGGDDMRSKLFRGITAQNMIQGVSSDVPLQFDQAFSGFWNKAGLQKELGKGMKPASWTDVRKNFVRALVGKVPYSPEQAQPWMEIIKSVSSARTPNEFKAAAEQSRPMWEPALGPNPGEAPGSTLGILDESEVAGRASEYGQQLLSGRLPIKEAMGRMRKLVNDQMVEPEN